MVYFKFKYCPLSAKGSDWMRLIFAFPFPLNSGAHIASAHFISNSKDEVSPCSINHGHSYNGAGLTNGGSAIQDNRVGTIQSFSSQRLSRKTQVVTIRISTKCLAYQLLVLFERTGIEAYFLTNQTNH